jgi:hypothetical protein
MSKNVVTETVITNAAATGRSPYVQRGCRAAWANGPHQAWNRFRFANPHGPTGDLRVTLEPATRGTGVQMAIEDGFLVGCQLTVEVSRDEVSCNIV